MRASEPLDPIPQLPSRLLLAAGTVHVQAGRNNPRFGKAMVKHNEAVVKAKVAIGKFEVVYRPAREFRFDKILQLVTPAAETATEGKRQINFVEQFIARHQALHHVPWVTELDMGAWRFGFGPQLASRSKRSKGEKRPRRDERISRLRRFKQRAAQQHDLGFAVQLLHE